MSKPNKIQLQHPDGTAHTYELGHVVDGANTIPGAVCTAEEWGEEALVLRRVMTARKPGTYSLAGVGMKFSAIEGWRVDCTACGWRSSTKYQAGTQ